jgi:WD40 repeat protein
MNRPGSCFYGWTDRNEIFTCGILDSTVRSFQADKEIITAEMSDNARYLALIFKNSQGSVFTRTGEKVFDFETTVNHLMNNRLVGFFPSGIYFMVAVKNSNAVIYDSAGTHMFELAGHTGRVNSLDISPDGRFIATASCDKTCLIWNFNIKTQQFSPYDTLVRYKDFQNRYHRPDSLIGPSDTIWSCEFSKSGKYILTASADSMLNIWSLNGYLRGGPLIFAVNSIRGWHWYWPLYYNRLMKADPMKGSPAPFYNKVYDARFTADEKAIIASNYNYTGMINGITDDIYKTCVFYYDGSTVTERQFLKNPFVLLAQRQSESEGMQTIKLLEVTSDLRLFAAVPYRNEIIQIVEGDGYHLLNIPGSFPFFSIEGKTIFYTYKNAIRTLPLDLKEIYNLVIEQKLFGNPEAGEEIWKIL